MRKAFIFSYQFDLRLSILSMLCLQVKGKSKHDGNKRDGFVNSITKFCQISSELLRRLYKKSIKYDALVISIGLGVSALIVSFLMQTR